MLNERLCLDFTNTVSWHNSEVTGEWLISYRKLVDWSHRAGILTEMQASTLLQKEAHQANEANEVLQQSIELREALYRIFSSVVKKESPAKKDISIFNKVLAKAYRTSHLVREDRTFSLRFDKSQDKLDGMLPPIIHSAADLLLSEKDLNRIKKCKNDPCGWLFLDTSRNHSRRWCSMAHCGNRKKARRFYQNNKGVKQTNSQ
ncbi:ABATE domain-containing protein [Alkalihalobacillus sp. TS-13]|uniref:CGNR zinc finger domain-containing protein n=1 Tax=Alkalihalobacillus sp. TS-13 TaxID=2842455 RepID=UPI0021AA389A|nr:ABATE domain-containing protein [Alkalihalobacillus sp. TS-13]